MKVFQGIYFIALPPYFPLLFYLNYSSPRAMAMSLARSLATPVFSNQLSIVVEKDTSSTRLSCSRFSSRRPSVALSRRGRRISCQVKGDDVPSGASPAVARKSILCSNCDGNGAVACNQCKGEGLNLEDHFQGRFKAGATCWLCRGKRQMLCGECNGAGFVGGFLSSSDD